MSKMSALALQKAGRVAEAEILCHEILLGNPNSAEAFHVLGIIAARLKRLEESERLLRRAIMLSPRIPTFQNDLGVTLEAMGKFDEAARYYRQAVHLNPDSHQTLTNLANALLSNGELEDAYAACHSAIGLCAGYALAHNALGCILLELGHIEPACEAFRHAIRMRADIPEFRANLGRALLTDGQFEEGWRHMAYLGDGALLNGCVRWNGSNPRGKTILLCGEGGMGNVIYFARYAKLVAGRGARIVIGCQRPLKRLLESMPCVDAVVGEGEALPHFDEFAPVTSLPRIFGTTESSIPAEVPYLSADPILIDQWCDELKRTDGLKVGIVWQGEQSTHYGRRRSIPLGHFASLSQVPGVRLICLQKDWKGSAAFPIDVLPDLDSEHGPFMDTAAVMKNLDLVITADTSAAHLAGALAVPVWVALPFAPDWRWMLNREDSPWYPTMRLFRQTQRGIWRDVFERMAKELNRMARRAAEEKGNLSAP